MKIFKCPMDSMEKWAKNQWFKLGYLIGSLVFLENYGYMSKLVI
jgi:hypothetical protein